MISNNRINLYGFGYSPPAHPTSNSVLHLPLLPLTKVHPERNMSTGVTNVSGPVKKRKGLRSQRTSRSRDVQFKTNRLSPRINLCSLRHFIKAPFAAHRDVVLVFIIYTTHKIVCVFLKSHRYKAPIASATLHYQRNPYIFRGLVEGVFF